jgi:S-DNA-T family DNA segregation ATPase FtsK/SpoIIIE
VGYGIRDKEGKMRIPKYINRSPILDGSFEIGMVYRYAIIPGLPATKMAKAEKEIHVFSDGLGKPVEIEFKKYLEISVFHKELPKMVRYDRLERKCEGWTVPLGLSLKGFIWHSFDHVPHMTVAGTTRFGKTVFLRMLMTYLIECYQDDVEFYIVDLKGGLEFGRYESIRMVRGVAANPLEAVELLQGIHEQMQKDYIHFRRNHYANIVDTPIKKRRFVIVDEAAQLAPERWMGSGEKKLLGECQWLLGEIARIGGALGIRLVFATQYPTADTLPRSIKQNADAKISFRLPSGYASNVAIDDYGAEELPSDVKGRALFKTHELREMQVPYLTHDEMWGRLEKYQKLMIMKGEAEDVVEYREEAAPIRTDLVQFRKNEVRHKKSNSKKTRI